MTLVEILIPLSWKIIKFVCMWIIKRIFHMIAILLNLIMIPHVIIMREASMVIEIFMLLNYLSLCEVVNASFFFLAYAKYCLP